jgi:hypothetical protein
VAKSAQNAFGFSSGKGSVTIVRIVKEYDTHTTEVIFVAGFEEHILCGRARQLHDQELLLFAQQQTKEREKKRESKQRKINQTPQQQH